MIFLKGYIFLCLKKITSLFVQVPIFIPKCRVDYRTGVGVGPIGTALLAVCGN